MNKTVPIDRPYHHGALREAMLAASERILEREGVPGLTLRAAAREAGASHAAPKNHFDDLIGLLSELAAVGFRRFSEYMMSAAAGETSARLRLRAIGLAYVTFAKDNPGLFQLMFRSERLDADRPALREATDQAQQILTDAVNAARIERRTEDAPVHGVGQVVAAWSLVHGFSLLLIDGRLNEFVAKLPDGATVEDLLAQVLG